MTIEEGKDEESVSQISWQESLHSPPLSCRLLHEYPCHARRWRHRNGLYKNPALQPDGRCEEISFVHGKFPARLIYAHSIDMSERSDTPTRGTGSFVNPSRHGFLAPYGAFTSSFRNPDVVRSYHFSMFFSLAVGLEDDPVVDASPALINDLNNLRDHDVGLLGSTTVFLGRGATFSVRKTRFPSNENVVLKSGMFFETQKPETESFLRLVNNIMLELRVLTHQPLRVHPNIVKLLRVSWEADAFIRDLKWPVLITELADMGTLQDFMENFKPLDWDLRISLMRDITSGLAALHDNGVVHGDLKLGNVLVFSSPNLSTPRAKLSDFGGALLDNPDELTCPMCTPPWTAPEYDMLRTRAELMKSDVYTLGLLLWQVLLNGSDPFQQIQAYDPASPREQQLSQIQSEKTSEKFFQLVSENLRACLMPEQFSLMSRVLRCCLALPPENRDLEYVMDQLNVGRNLYAFPSA